MALCIGGDRVAAAAPTDSPQSDRGRNSAFYCKSQLISPTPVRNGINMYRYDGRLPDATDPRPGGSAIGRDQHLGTSSAPTRRSRYPRPGTALLSVPSLGSLILATRRLWHAYLTVLPLQMWTDRCVSPKENTADR